MLAAAALIAVPAEAQLCDGGYTPGSADGRTLGHLPYGDAPDTELASVPTEETVAPCVLRRDVLPDLARLIAASGGRVKALSCHRSISRQAAVFCRGGGASALADKAISVAPPGHSEHSSGYALDFAFRPRENDCPDAEACVAATGAFRWLKDNAPKYGFEMSFPVSNRQNVKWEPWHWRWVGTSASAPGAARARMLFARARREFPASPGVDAVPVVTIAQVVPPPVYMGAIPAPVCKRGKCKVAKAR